MSMFLNTAVDPPGTEAGFGENESLPFTPLIVIVTAPPPGDGLVGVVLPP